jgi:nitroreductase
VAGPATRERLLEPALRLAACKYSRCDDDPAKLPPKLRDKVRGKLLTPGALVVVLLRRDPDPFRDRENYAATACAIQNLMLAATHEGLGSKWGTGGVTRDAQTAAILGVDTASEEVVGFISLGKPELVPTMERPPVEDHVTRLP